MTQDTPSTMINDQPLASRIATLMRIGTVVASFLLTGGAVLLYTQMDRAATILLAGGCGLLILLPVVRLTMMAVHFTQLTDIRFVLITFAVVTFVIMGGVIGVVL